jgi:NAD(P)-dependent dehydrogenase (short-subunit alcohol dehydrogenase family)
MGWQDRFSLKGRKALVTGASKGIGAEICAVFAEAGADIVALGRDEADLATTADAVRAQGRRCLTLIAEMASPTEPVEACERALAEWGAIDILVNSAGIANVAPAVDFSTDDWDRMMAAYAASKGGLNALTKSLCAEWARHNVQVNAICPTVVMTPMGKKVWGRPEKGDPFRNATPARRFAEPVEVADAALYLASDGSSMVNGALLMVEGGFTSV